MRHSGFPRMEDGSSSTSGAASGSSGKASAVDARFKQGDRVIVVGRDSGGGNAYRAATVVAVSTQRVLLFWACATAYLTVLLIDLVATIALLCSEFATDGLGLQDKAKWRRFVVQAAVACF